MAFAWLTTALQALFTDKTPASGLIRPASWTTENTFQADDANDMKAFLNELRTHVAQTPQQNILPNTQWQVGSGLSGSAQRTELGTGYEAAMTVSGHTTGSNTVTFTVNSTGNLRANDLVAIDGVNAPQTFKNTYLRVATVAATTFTAKLYGGNKSVDAFTASYNATIAGIGNASSISTGDAFDHWTKSSGGSGLIVWRDSWPSNTKAGSKYSCGMLKGAAGLQYIHHSPLVFRDLDRFKGRKVVFGCWVKQRVKGGSGTWRVVIQTNAGIVAGSAMATSQEFTWLEVTTTLSASITQLDFMVELAGNASDVYYLSQPMAGFGEFLGEGNYVQPRNEYLVPIVHVQFNSFNGASPALPTSLAATDGKGTDTDIQGTDNSAFKTFDVDPYAETNGIVAPTVREIVVKVEGRCESEGDALGFSNNNVAGAAHVFGPLMYSVRSGFMMTPQKASVPLDGNGKCYTHGGTIPMTGTVNITSGTPTVNGTSTRFLTELSVGMLVILNGAVATQKVYRVKSRASDTVMTLGYSGGADADYDEANVAGGGLLKMNPNWYNWAVEINAVLLS